MALPTIEKTWQYNVNQLYGGLGGYSDDQDLLFKIKETLKGFATNPWTVWGSCNGAGGFGNNDGVDRWLSRGNCVWNTAVPSAHSWIVLRQSQLSSTLLWCFDCYSFAYSTAAYAAITLFPSGVTTPGTATARPSATDEIQVRMSSPQQYTWGGADASTGRLHGMQSSDGQCTRIITCRAGQSPMLWLFDVVKNPVAGWVDPWVHAICTQSNNTNTLAYTYLNDRSDDRYGASYGKIGTASSIFYLASEGYGSATIGETFTYPDDDTVEYPISPVYIASATTGSRGACKGTIRDLWWGSTFPATGDCYPADGSKQLVQFGHLVFPWNGSTPLVA